MDVWDRLPHPEDGLTERKPESAGGDFKIALVALANTAPAGKEDVLFIGVGDKGEVLGCKGIDSLQKTISRICRDDCYPPIEHQMAARNLDGKAALAVIIPHSPKRPHFSGHAYHRVGAKSEKSDETQYLEFIASRSTAGAKLLEYKGRPVKMYALGKKFGEPAPLEQRYEEGDLCVIEACDPHGATFSLSSSGRRVYEPLENFSVGREPNGDVCFWVVLPRH